MPALSACSLSCPVCSTYPPPISRLTSYYLKVIISTFKPKLKPKATQQASAVKSADGKKKPRPTPTQLANEMRFDVRLARGSYMIDILSHTLVTFSSTAMTTTAQFSFVGYTSLSSLGAGVVPALQSLALCVIQADAAEEEALTQGQEQQASPGEVDSGRTHTSKVKAPRQGTGTLFGAFAVLQATGQMILGVCIQLYPQLSTG